MSNWKHIREESEEGSLDFEILEVDDYWVLTVCRNSSDGFDVDNGETLIGNFATLDEARQAAVAWMLQHIAGMLDVLGAEGIWLVRGAFDAYLHFAHRDSIGYAQSNAIMLEPPHELILLARFPAGDGREQGVQSL